ncbi:MAG: FAD-binding protein, partial [Angelakisella sp.]|nr:FAD-binding protein [Angelakisella sp.]
MTSLWNTALGDTGVPFQMGEPLSRHTTFRIGGAAEYYVSPKSIPELERLLAACRTQGIPYFILGKGSNLLVGDRGIPGLTIAMEGLSAITVEGERVTAQGGASLMAVCAAARQAGLAGLEFAYGIPGQVGGGVYMNAGAYGGELKDVLIQVEFLDEGGKRHTLPVEKLEMGYRHSFFTGKNCVILSACFCLEKDPEGPEAVGARMEEIYRRRR